MAVESDWITRWRQATTAWLQALNTLQALGEQYQALDYGNALSEEDFVGANADIVQADLVAAVGSVQTLTTTFEQGHNTNLYKMIV
jgi:hypothetical protein